MLSPVKFCSITSDDTVQSKLHTTLEGNKTNQLVLSQDTDWSTRRSLWSVIQVKPSLQILR